MSTYTYIDISSDEWCGLSGASRVMEANLVGFYLCLYGLKMSVYVAGADMIDT